MYNEKAWVNQDLIKKYLDFIYPPVDFDRQGKLLVWDSCRAHIARSVKELIVEKGVVEAVILEDWRHMSKLGISEYSKVLRIRLEIWLMVGRIPIKLLYTARGNPKPPSDTVMANWVKQAWRQVPIEVIQKSIKAAGFGSWEEWHISKHDVYWERFKTLWSSNLEEKINEQNAEEYAQDPVDEIEDDYFDEGQN